MAEGRFGIMVHYLIDPAGATPAARTAKFNRLVSSFDLDAFVSQFASTSADWLIFTIGQNTGFYCSPNPYLDRLLPGHTSDRDLMLEIATRLKALGKRVVAYLPAEVSHQGEEVQDAFAWSPADQGEFQRRYCEFVRRYALKLGPMIDGWWFDGCFEWPQFHNSLYEWPEWIAAARAGNPDAAVAFNDGSFCINKVKPVTLLEDYHAGEVHMLVDGKIKLGHEDNSPLYLPEGQFIEGVQWHALVPVDSTFEGGEPHRYSDQVLLQFMQNCRSVKGAVTLNLPIGDDGCLPGDSLAQMQRLGRALGTPWAVRGKAHVEADVADDIRGCALNPESRSTWDGRKTKASMSPLSVGLPGRLKCSVTPCR